MSALGFLSPRLVSPRLADSTGRNPLLESLPLLVEAFVRYDECVDCCDHSNFGDGGVENCHACLVGSYQCVLLRGLSEDSNLELIAAPDVVCLHFTYIVVCHLSVSPAVFISNYPSLDMHNGT